MVFSIKQILINHIRRKIMSRDTTVVTGSKTRFAYLRVFEPKENGAGKDEYSACLIIPKSSTRTIDKINAAINAACSILSCYCSNGGIK